MKLGDEFGAASFTIKNWGYRMIVYNIYIYTCIIIIIVIIIKIIIIIYIYIHHDYIV